MDSTRIETSEDESSSEDEQERLLRNHKSLLEEEHSYRFLFNSCYDGSDENIEPCNNKFWVLQEWANYEEDKVVDKIKEMVQTRDSTGMAPRMAQPVIWWNNESADERLDEKPYLLEDTAEVCLAVIPYQVPVAEKLKKFFRIREIRDNEQFMFKGHTWNDLDRMFTRYELQRRQIQTHNDSGILTSSSCSRRTQAFAAIVNEEGRDQIHPEE